LLVTERGESILSPDDLILVGVIGKAHGIRGGFYLDGSIDGAALKPGFEVLIGDRRYEIVSRGGLDARPILSFAGIESRDAAEALRGSQAHAPRGTLTPLADGEWYAQDLEGLRVVTGDRSQLGLVVRLTNAPSVDFLEVTRDDGSQLLLPMLRDAIIRIDVAAGQILVNDEFLDLG
jgi:16S rRNA processing protein RimM